MAGSEATVIHSRRCGNPACGALFGICQACDRGQRYCSPACRGQARVCRHRVANRRYQDSRRGRHFHSQRQERYRRAKNKVTDTGSQSPPGKSMVVPCLPCTTVPDEPSPRRCLRCGRRASPNGNQMTTALAPPDAAWPDAPYVASVLRLYVELPHTPARASAEDRAHAQRLLARGVPQEIVETALVLASLRRIHRPGQAPPLGAIRSLAYFQPVIEELLAQPSGRGYLAYLRRKLAATRARLPVTEQQP